VESQEHLGGFYIIEAEDLDAALGWASKTTAIVGAPIEVRSGTNAGPDVVRDANAAPGTAPRIDEAGVDRIFREESGRSVATLIRVFGDIDVAEDAVQEAFAVALRKWPGDGLPPNPGGWITMTARRRAIDRLRLIFTCCHPALSTEAQVALTLRLLGGLATDEVARAFLVAEPTMAQRLVRAKRKIKAARIPVPGAAGPRASGTSTPRPDGLVSDRQRRGGQRGRRAERRRCPSRRGDPARPAARLSHG
jgi:DNA-directed RNA polymerase specialized sigma24 family protein